MTVKSEQAVYTLVVGLGKTGLSVVRYLRALGEAVVVVDSRDVSPGLSTLKNGQLASVAPSGTSMGGSKSSKSIQRIDSST